MNTNGNKPGRTGDEDMRNQLEVLRLMEQYREDVPQEQVPLVKPAPQKTEPVRPKRSVKEVLTGILYGIIPVAGDPPREILRKVIFVVALLTLIGSCGYIVNDMVIQPAIVAGTTDQLNSLYTPGETAPELTPEEEAFDYPEGIMDSFLKLYYLNQDLYGWISFSSTSSNSWLDINYPVMHAADNDYYLRKDYYGNYCKTGTLFIDYRNDPARYATNKNTIIYGHNSASGQMFSRLNYLAYNNLYNPRSATTFRFDNLYEEREYKVFAVMICNTREQEGPIFNYMRTNFSTEEDFLQFVAECRERSLYDYPVDVNGGDELVMLSTCAPSSKTHVKESRTVVVARKVRPGESAAVNAAAIVKNNDCIFPLAYYTSQDLEPHPYYEGGYIITPEGGVTQSTVPTVPTSTNRYPGTSSSWSGITPGSSGQSSQSTRPGNTTLKPTPGTTSGNTPSITTPQGPGTTKPTTPSATAPSSGGSTTLPSSGGDSTTPSSDPSGSTSSSDGSSSSDGGDSTTPSSDNTTPSSSEGGDTTSSETPAETTTSSEAPADTTTEPVSADTTTAGEATESTVAETPAE